MRGEEKSRLGDLCDDERRGGHGSEIRATMSGEKKSRLGDPCDDEPSLVDFGYPATKKPASIFPT